VLALERLAVGLGEKRMRPAPVNILGVLAQ
jgi:hypothetical protein